jgi:heme exporter protein D
VNGWGWIVGGYLVYVGLAIGAALFVALAIAVVRGQRRLRSLEERLARAERADRAEQPVAPRSVALVVPEHATEDDDEALVPTPLGQSEDLEPTEQVDREMFWDLLLRESVVRAAAVGHGLRAVLDPRTRNRIRFEVKQEIKRARKQRRSEERAAVRQLRQDRLEDSA